MEYLIGIIAGLVGLVGFLFVKNQSASALLQNLGTKEKVTDLDKNINKDEDYLVLEDAKRKELESQLNKGSSAQDTLNQLNDFFKSDK